MHAPTNTSRARFALCARAAVACLGRFLVGWLVFLFVFDVLLFCCAGLNAQTVVVTYAAMAIERMLAVKDRTVGQRPTLRLQKESLAPFLESLFTGLFAVSDSMTRVASRGCTTASLLLVYPFQPTGKLPLTRTTIAKRLCRCLTTLIAKFTPWLLLCFCDDMFI